MESTLKNIQRDLERIPRHGLVYLLFVELLGVVLFAAIVLAGFYFNVHEFLKPFINR